MTFEMLSGESTVGLAKAKPASTISRMTKEANCGAAVRPRHRWLLSCNRSATAVIAVPRSALLVVELQDRLDARFVVEAEGLDVIADGLAGGGKIEQRH